MIFWENKDSMERMVVKEPFVPDRGARCAGEVMMIPRIWMMMFLTAVAVMAASSALALTADVYGYTKAEYVKGNLQVAEDTRSLELTGFSHIYRHPMEVYISKGYDPAEAKMIGVLSPGFKGTATFDIPETGVTNEDMVLFMVPGWSVPVAVGLFRDEDAVFYKPPKLDMP